jgi:hypothetical protein
MLRVAERTAGEHYAWVHERVASLMKIVNGAFNDKPDFRRFEYTPQLPPGAQNRITCHRAEQVFDRVCAQASN